MGRVYERNQWIVDMKNSLRSIPFILFIAYTSCDDSSSGPTPERFQKNSDLIYERSGGIFGMQSDGSDTLRMSPTDIHLRADIDGGNPFSPDGSMFMTVDDNNGLVLVKLDGSGVVRLASADIYYPDWSPDGDRILYAMKTSSASLGDLYVINADGTNVQNLTQSLADYRAPRWTSDGRIMYLVLDGNGNRQLKIMNATNSVTIDTGMETVSDFRLSNSSSKVALKGRIDASSEWGIYTMDLDGSGILLLSNLISRRIHDWSPDDSKLLFTTQNSVAELWNVFSVNTDGSSSPINLSGSTNAADKGWNPSWSSDGSEVAFSIRDFTNMRGYDIYKANADGSNLINLTNYVQPLSGHFSVFWCPF